MIFVVLGMHKSGTTLTSQILHHSGINMGDFDENISYDRGNKYERQSTLELDMEILQAEDVRILKLSSGQRDESEVLLDRMRAIIADCEAAHDDWGFKDPRSLLVYDLWEKQLPEHRIVAIYRDPAEVWSHFKWGPRRIYRNFSQAYNYLAVWHEHNEILLRLLESTQREHVLINYRDLMTGDAAFSLLERFVGRKLDDRRKPGLYRNRRGRDLFLWCADTWMKLRTGVSIRGTMARLDRLKTPLEG